MEEALRQVARIRTKCQKYQAELAARYELWVGITELRNALVHNNGVADKTASYIFPDVRIEFSDGQMARGGILLFPALVDWVVDAYRDSCIAFLTP